MKRDISCSTCVVMWREIAKDPKVIEAGEKTTITAGTARRDYLCDHCGEQIASGTECHAVGVVAPGQRDLPGWEQEFVLVAPAAEPTA